MRRFVPVPPPARVPDSWEDSDEEQIEEPTPLQSLDHAERQPAKPAVQLLKRTQAKPNNSGRSSSRPVLSLMDTAQRQDHYERTRKQIFANHVEKPAAAAAKPQRVTPAARSRAADCNEDPDFIRDASLYMRRFDPGFGLNGNTRGDTCPERTYESEFPDALPRR